METSHNNGYRLRFGQFELDLSEGKLYDRGRPVRLENQPFQILAALLKRPGEVIGREELRTRLWSNGTYVDFDDGLNTAISKLRYALHDSAETPVFVATIPRRGYKFLAPVLEISDHHDNSVNGFRPASIPASATGAETASVSEPDAGSNSPASIHIASPNRRGVAAFLIGLFVLVAAAGWGIYRWRAHMSESVNREGMEIRKLTDTGNVNAVAISPDGRYVIYARRIGENTSLRMRQLESGGDVEVLPAAKVNFVGLTFSPDGSYLYFVRSHEDDSGYKDLYVMPALGGPARKLIPGIDSPVSFSPDGRQIVFTVGFPTKSQIEVRIANSDGTGNHLLTTMQESYAGNEPGATWSPDGRTIAVPIYHQGSKFTTALYDVSLAEGRQQELYSTDGNIGRPLWLPNGAAMLVPLEETNDGRGQLWTIAFPSGKKERFTNDVSDYAMILDMTPDARNAVTVETTVVSNIWASPAAGISRVGPITHGDAPSFEAVETNGGKLLVQSPNEIWIMNADGTARASFAKMEADHICMSETFVVAHVWEEGGVPQIVRLDPDGTHEVALAKGNIYSPACSPDGKFIFYVDFNQPIRILRVPIEGGEPFEIAKTPGDGVMGGMEISNDGKSLVFVWEKYDPVPGMHFSVISSADGSLLKSFPAPSGINGRLRFSPDDNNLHYILTRDGVDNLWQQDLSGGPPRQLTKFTSGLIFGFNWSKNHKRLFLARGSVTTDVVLLTHLR